MLFKRYAPAGILQKIGSVYWDIYWDMGYKFEADHSDREAVVSLLTATLERNMLAFI